MRFECLAPLRSNVRTNWLTLLFFLSLSFPHPTSPQVFRAIDSLTGAVVAVKRLPLTTAGSAAALAREVGLLSALSHRHVVRCAAAFAARGHLALVLEHCAAGSLERPLAPGGGYGPLPEPLAAAILSQVLSGLAYLHSQVRHKKKEIEREKGREKTKSERT